MFDNIKSIKLDKKELKKYTKTLYSHNLVLGKYAKLNGKRPDLFVKTFYKKEFQKNLANSEQKDVLALTEDVKTKIVAHHINMIKDIVNKFVFCYEANDFVEDLLVSEAMYATMIAILRYNNIDIKFSTFCTTVVYNRLVNCLKRERNFSKRGWEVKKKIIDHIKKSNDGTSYNRAMSEIDLTDKDLKYAFRVQQAIVSIEDNELKLSNFDVNSEQEFLEILNHCSLSELERFVLSNYLFDKDDWLVNTQTKFPHPDGSVKTKQYFSSVLKTAKKKFISYYESNGLKEVA